MSNPEIPQHEITKYNPHTFQQLATDPAIFQASLPDFITRIATSNESTLGLSADIKRVHDRIRKLYARGNADLLRQSSRVYAREKGILTHNAFFNSNVTQFPLDYTRFNPDQTTEWENFLEAGIPRKYAINSVSFLARIRFAPFKKLYDPMAQILLDLFRDTRFDLAKSLIPDLKLREAPDLFKSPDKPKQHF